MRISLSLKKIPYLSNLMKMVAQSNGTQKEIHQVAEDLLIKAMKMAYSIYSVQQTIHPKFYNLVQPKGIVYRFGFNGKEQDDDVSGSGNSYDYGFRIYNPRIGKFLSVDPLSQEYPWYTPYQFAGNKPIMAIDLDGLEEYIITTRQFMNSKGKPVTYKVDYRYISRRNRVNTRNGTFVRLGAVTANNGTLETQGDGNTNLLSHDWSKKDIRRNLRRDRFVDAFQGSDLTADPNSTNSYYKVNDGVESYFVGSAVPGATQIGVDESGNTTMHGHHPSHSEESAFQSNHLSLRVIPKLKIYRNKSQ